MVDRRTRHIDIRHYFATQAIQDRVVRLFWCTTEDTMADILNKPLDRFKHEKYRTESGMSMTDT